MDVLDAEVGDGPSRDVPVQRGEVLGADHHPGRVGLAYLGNEVVPLVGRDVGLARQGAAEQREDRPRLPAAGPGVQHAVVQQVGAMLVERRLEGRRTGLVGTDVEEHRP